MDINIDFLHVINPFWYLFHFFSVTLLAMLPQRKPKNLLKNHLTTFAKSNDRFGLNRTNVVCLLEDNYRHQNRQLQ